MKTGLFDCFSTTHCTLHIPPAYTSAMKIQMLILTTRGDDRINLHLANPETAQALSDSDAQEGTFVHPNASKIPIRTTQYIQMHPNRLQCIQFNIVINVSQGRNSNLSQYIPTNTSKYRFQRTIVAALLTSKSSISAES